MATNGVTQRQKRAIAAILVEPTIKAAAATANVGERSLHRWLADDKDFQRYLRLAQDEAVSRAIARLAGELPDAVNTLADIHKNADGKPSTRVQAAKALLSEHRHTREFGEILVRLDELENFINERN